MEQDTTYQKIAYLIINDECEKSVKNQGDMNCIKESQKDLKKLVLFLESQQFMVFQYENSLQEDLDILESDLNSNLEEYKNEKLVVFLYYLGCSEIKNNSVHAVCSDGEIINLEFIFQKVIQFDQNFLWANFDCFFQKPDPHIINKKFPGSYLLIKNQINYNKLSLSQFWMKNFQNLKENTGIDQLIQQWKTDFQNQQQISATIQFFEGKFSFKGFPILVLEQDNALNQKEIDGDSKFLLNLLTNELKEKKIKIFGKFKSKLTIQDLSNFLKNNPTFDSLEIQITPYELSSELYQSIGTAISENNNLTLIKITQEFKNSSTDKNFTILNQIKNIFSKINILNEIQFELSACELNDEGFQNLQITFQNIKNISVLQLDVSFNEFQDEGIIQVSQAIKQLTNLNSIYLMIEENNISDKGIIALLESVSVLPQLSILDIELEGNKISKVGINKIEEFKKKFSSIEISIGL